MPPKKRPTTTKGRMVCSIAEDKRQSKGVPRRGIQSEFRAPIGKKFVHKTIEKSSKSLPKSSEIQKKKTQYELWVDQVIDMGIRNIRREFIATIRTYTPSGTTIAWEADKNYDKNRFEDIKLLDRTRVILRNTPSNDDYYHASYVQISENINFICAQGPLPNTVEDFWCMVIQEDSKVIVQLCQWTEDGKTQCTEYFPQSDWEYKNYGAIRVKIIQKTSPISQLRKVYRTKLQAIYKDKTHEVLHLLYTGWPDHFVADSTPVCREVQTMALKFSEKKPIIVHCSAGIGRTGTFAAIFMAADRIKHVDNFSIPDVVKELRDQRMHAVQNDQQYLFIYRMVIEILLAEDLLIKSPDIISLIKEYDDLIARKRQERMRKGKK
ncbi:Protein-tyrosine phosphatase [Onchocerca flexuosa]|uniref:Protein-tyrosine phosphatase n=1 Tax=Onchocerca flexuosa TaxID=387005 RepID=A0A238C1I6_9BILA|nr:Protein-tyrosine phosphatase [Onchocerca flexuosa]